MNDKEWTLGTSVGADEGTIQATIAGTSKGTKEEWNAPSNEGRNKQVNHLMHACMDNQHTMERASTKHRATTQRTFSPKHIGRRLRACETSHPVQVAVAHSSTTPGAPGWHRRGLCDYTSSQIDHLAVGDHGLELSIAVLVREGFGRPRFRCRALSAVYFVVDA